MYSLSLFTSKGGELLYNFCYLVSCLLVIFMLFHEWRRTEARHQLYLLYAFVVMVINLVFTNFSLVQELFFGATRSNFWFPVITWNLQALSLIFITGAFVYPLAHEKIWLKKYISYNIILLVFSFCIITPLWLNKFFLVRDYNEFWGAYYYNAWLCLLLVITVGYLHFYAAKYYPDVLLRVFLGVLLFHQSIHLGRILFPQSFFADSLIVMEYSLPLLASLILLMTIYNSIVSSLVETNRKLDAIRRELDQSNQALELKVLDRTREISEANKELLRFKDFHENILQSLSDGILVVSGNGRIMTLNRAAQENLKVDGFWAMGKMLSEFFPPPEGVNWGELIQNVVQSKQGVSLNKLYCKLTALEEDIVVNLQGQPLKDKELNEIGVVFTLEFITEKVKLEAKIKRSERLAYMGEIAAGVAHEIRNPLNSISINLQLLRRALLKDKNTQFVERFNVIRSEISRLDGIVEEFIQFARPKKMKLHNKNVNQILEEIISLINQQAAMANVCINKELGELPPIDLDEAQMKQVFLNIGINAIQAMPQGGPLLFKTELVNQNKIKISISDKGKGISAAEQKKIFEPFYSTKDDGVGLGLAIAQHIVEEHNGTIELESNEGEGTTFIITLLYSKT